MKKMKPRLPKEIRNLPLSVKAEMALKEAVAEALAEHKRLGIPPEEIVVPEV
jgi:hypothetical protein